jgi:glutathione S-transferase
VKSGALAQSRGMKLYGSSDSGNCLKVKWVAERMGIPFEWIETSSFSGETRTPEFLAINPAGQVPVAVLGDGRILAQSNAMMLYFAEHSDLVPRDAYDRAKMFEWLFWEQYSHEPAIAVRIARKYFLAQKDDELDPALLTKGNAALARMELQLRQTPFLVGAAMTLADVALVAYTRYAHRGGFDLNAYPSVKNWVARVENALGLETALPVGA